MATFAERAKAALTNADGSPNYGGSITVQPHEMSEAIAYSYGHVATAEEIAAWQRRESEMRHMASQFGAALVHRITELHRLMS